MDLAAIVFDLDGVLLDSEQVWEEVRREFVREHGGRWPPDSQRTMMGMNTAEWAGHLVGLGVREPPERVAAEVIARVAHRYRQAPPLLPGAPEAVRRLGRRWPLGLASSSSRSLLELVLDQTDLARSFRAVVSSEEVAHGKPAPDVYLEAARRLDVDPRDCLAVEDSANGLRAAAAAGMRVIAVPNEHFPPPRDALALAAARVESAADVTPNLLNSLDAPPTADG